MKHGLLGLLAGLAALAGCAGNPHQQPPAIARLTPAELERLVPAPTPSLGVDEIVALSKSGTPPATIIARIRDSRSSYRLTPREIVELAGRGVSVEVLDAMHAAGQQALRDAIADEVNQREEKQRLEIQRLQRELTRRPYYYDPWPYPPYWHDPFYRPYWYR